LPCRRHGSAGAAGAVEGAALGGVTLAAMILVAIGLLVLGSLPASYGSVWLALGSLADRRGVPHENTERGAGCSRASSWEPCVGLGVWAARCRG
jgi:hypothetical protein